MDQIGLGCTKNNYQSIKKTKTNLKMLIVSGKLSGARFSRAPVTFRARSFILKSKSMERWRSF